ACWLACQMFDALGNRVSLLIHEFKQGLEAGASEVLLCLDKPNLRQGEYVVTFELLPLFDYHWSEPHRIPYLCLWDRCVFFKVDENYHGSIALGLVSLSSSVSTRRLVQPAVRTLGRDAAQVSR